MDSTQRHWLVTDHKPDSSGFGPDSRELGLAMVEEPPTETDGGIAAAVECHEGQGSGPDGFLAVSS